MSQAYDDKWEIVRAQQAGRCFIEGCKKPMTQLAHVLPQDMLHYRLYGKAVIDHYSNVRGVCGTGNSTPHNAAVQINHRSHPLAANQWAEVVRSIIEGEKQ